MSQQKSKNNKSAPKKFSDLAKKWKAFSKNKNNHDKLVDFYKAFLNAELWLKLDPSEERNYSKFKKRGINRGEKFKVAIDTNGVVLLFESFVEHKKFAEKGLERGQKIKYCSIKQCGEELICSLSKNTRYAIKLKGVKDFVQIMPENVAFMKKILEQKN